MKTKVILVIITILFFGSNSFAQPETKENKEKKQQDLQSPPPPPIPLPGIAPLNIPGLTKEQHEKLKATDVKHLIIIIPLIHQVAEKQARLETILTSDTVDKKELNNVADEIGKLKTEILKQQLIHDQEMRGILSMEQKIYFDVMPKPFLLN